MIGRMFGFASRSNSERKRRESRYEGGVFPPTMEQLEPRQHLSVTVVGRPNPAYPLLDWRTVQAIERPGGVYPGSIVVAGDRFVAQSVCLPSMITHVIYGPVTGTRSTDWITAGRLYADLDRDKLMEPGEQIAQVTKATGGKQKGRLVFKLNPQQPILLRAMRNRKDPLSYVTMLATFDVSPQAPSGAVVGIQLVSARAVRQSDNKPLPRWNYRQLKTSQPTRLQQVVVPSSATTAAAPLAASAAPIAKLFSTAPILGDSDNPVWN